MQDLFPLHVPLDKVISPLVFTANSAVILPDNVGDAVRVYALPLPINIDPFDGSAFRPVPPRVIGMDPVVFAIFK